jgi:hypothetical protein
LATESLAALLPLQRRLDVSRHEAAIFIFKLEEEKEGHKVTLREGGT